MIFWLPIEFKGFSPTDVRLINERIFSSKNDVSFTFHCTPKQAHIYTLYSKKCFKITIFHYSVSQRKYIKWYLLIRACFRFKKKCLLRISMFNNIFFLLSKNGFSLSESKWKKSKIQTMACLDFIRKMLRFEFFVWKKNLWKKYDENL